MRILAAHDAEGNIHQVVVIRRTHRLRQSQRNLVYW